MTARARAPATADLFAAATSDAAAMSNAAVMSDAVDVHVAAPPATAVHSRPKHLWYAVVFPQLASRHPAGLLERLGLHARQFTSWVSLEMPDGLLLEINGSAKLFGSLETLHAALDAVWSRLSLAARSATAPSTLAALWLARAGGSILIDDPGRLAGVLAPLPTACTGWDEERLATLRAMGVTHLGELLRLPRAGLARRFGPTVPFELDVALARQAAPRRSFVPRERFRERLDLETEIESLDGLCRVCLPLVDRCAQFLRARRMGVQSLELRLRHRARADTRVRLGLAGVTSARCRLADVLVHTLARLALASPVRGVELVSATLRPLAAASLEVFAPGGAAGGRDTAPQLVERLRARLGERAVYGICTVAEHRPEAAWRRLDELPLQAARGHGRGCAQRLSRHGLDEVARPAWLLQEPVMLFASDLQRVQRGDLILEQGPERIESGWWDGKDVVRDYYQARQMGGARLWVFQERRSERWYLHGVFA